MKCAWLHLLCLVIFFNGCMTQTIQKFTWCTISTMEQAKCLALKSAVGAVTELNTNFQFECLYGGGSFECMSKVKDLYADMMTLETGLAYWAAELYTLQPLVAENYGDGAEATRRVLDYYAAVVVSKTSTVKLSVEGLSKRTLCTAGVGTAAGWVLPMGKLVKQMKLIPVDQCNSRVSTVVNFFGNMCAPGALEQAFNNFGDNPLLACTLCQQKNDANHYCRFSDLFAGNAGALNCSTQHNTDLVFLRAGQVEVESNSTNSIVNANDYELLCPVMETESGAKRSPLSEVGNCNWGKVPAQIVMTAPSRSLEDRRSYRNFLAQLVRHFGPNGVSSAIANFTLFQSISYGARDLLFSDFTRSFYEGSQGIEQKRLDTFYNWVAPLNFLDSLEDLRYCPIPDARWCVITDNEMKKCEQMKLAFLVKGLKPDLNCVLGKSTLGCITLISQGFADLMTLDAGDLYAAGKNYGLVPIATEYYGSGDSYYAVAIVRKPDAHVIISNLRNKKTCHSAIGTATGWVVPLNMVLDTNQIRVYNCHLMYAYSELVSRACIPGIMNVEYNPTNYNPINLCESCSGGGDDRCQRDARELYFGDAGAFRCLVELAGDVAFARHTTVNENTGGRNPSHWARNRRSDDYELMCRDGSRRNVGFWQQCNLGRIPGRTVVTSEGKTSKERQRYWQLLQYAQEYYASDSNPEFQMFSSGYDNADLMFTDSAESLRWIPREKQNYRAWLGADFLKKLETLENVACFKESGLVTSNAPRTLAYTFSSFLTVLGVMLLKF